MTSNKKGRQGRKPTKARYNNERRWEKNKERRIKKQKNEEEKQKIRKQKRISINDAG